MIILDIETTGADQKRCAIVNIGAIDLNNPDNRFFEECQVPKDAFIDDFVLTYNGFDPKVITSNERKSHKEMMIDFRKWLEGIEDWTFAGQNIRFDINFLYALADKLEINDYVFGKRFVDLHSACYGHMARRGVQIPLENHLSALNSDKVMEYVGLPSEPKPHRMAITGAIYEAEAFSRLFYGKNLLQEFEKFEIPEYLK